MERFICLLLLGVSCSADIVVDADNIKVGKVSILSSPYRNSEYYDYNSISIHFDEYLPTNGIVDAYELSFRSSFDSYWTVYQHLGATAENRSEAQIVSVRVDSGQIMTKGTFTLGILYANMIPEDFENAARTPPIPFDATSAQLRAALSALKGVTVKTVVRCDEFGNLTHSFGGFDGWFYHCPYQSQGGYRWLIVLDAQARDRHYLPLLYPFRENLGGTWSEHSEQVSVTRIHHGVSPSFCTVQGMCTLVAKQLEEGTPYLFRYRAHISTSGWTGYSETSQPMMTLARRIPPKPRVPLAQSSRLTSITFSVQAFPLLLGVTKFDSQYRVVGEREWRSGPVLQLEDQAGEFPSGNDFLRPNSELDSRIYVVIFDKLQPGTAYEVRVRAWNLLGVGPFSSISTSYSTQQDDSTKPSVLSPQVLLTEIGDTTLGVNLLAFPDSAGLLSTENYLLQYKPSSATRWLNHTNIFQFTVRREGVEVQEIEIRSDSKKGCNGSFWLQLPGMLPNLIETSITTAISFSASEDEFNNAILSIPRIAASNSRVTTQRRLNKFNGFIWTLNIEGMGNIARFTTSRHALTNSETSGECWTGAGSVISTRTLKDGNELLYNITQHATITGLQQQTNYDLRLVRIDSRTSSQTVSEVVTAMTIPSTRGWDDDSTSQKKYLDSTNPTLPGSYAEAAIWKRAARTLDFHYALGSSNGGDTGKRGEDGSCVVLLYRPGLSQAYSSQYFFYSGKEEVFSLPVIQSQSNPVHRVTVKCWGGGGGGGLVPYIDYHDLTSEIAAGGGGAFAQASLSVNSGDKLKITVGGGGSPPQAEFGGAGGYGGGGDGGNALRGGAGGGGGGASTVMYLPVDGSATLLLTAAGGGGAGSTTYCCADGGGGGVTTGGNGTSSGDNTPWPLTDPADGRPTPIRRRWEYTSANCTSLGDDDQDAWCTSPWDLEERSLPADHLDVDYGEKPDANYSLWSSGGSGGSLLAGGLSGISGGYEVTSIPDEQLVSFTGGAIVFGLNKRSAINPLAQPGLYLKGGHGAGGKKGGGGGGGGYYGGGGGGSGVDGAGGGGGSSFVNTDLVINNAQAFSPLVSTTTPELVHLTNEAAEFSWDGSWVDSRGRYVREYAVEMAIGNYSEDFHLVTTSKVVMDSLNQASQRTFQCVINSLEPEQLYSLRILPLLSNGYGPPSQILKFQTLANAQNYWEPVLTHRLAVAGTGRGLNPVLSRPHLDVGVEIFEERTSVNPFRVTDPPTATTPALPSSRRGHSLSLVEEFVYMFGGRTDGESATLLLPPLSHTALSLSR
jgi:hypothetical protein